MSPMSWMLARWARQEREWAHSGSPAARDRVRAPSDPPTRRSAPGRPTHGPSAQRLPISAIAGSTTEPVKTSSENAPSARSRTAFAASSSGTKRLQRRAKAIRLGVWRAHGAGGRTARRSRLFRGLGRGHSLAEQGAHRVNPFLVGGGVEAKPARAPFRLDQVVPALPGANRLRAYPGSPGKLADPHRRPRRRSGAGGTALLPSGLCSGWTIIGQTLDKRECNRYKVVMSTYTVSVQTLPHAGSR